MAASSYVSNAISGIKTRLINAERSKVLAYAEATSVQTGIVPGATDITGLTITFTPDERALDRAIVLKAFVPFILNKTAAGIPSLLLTTSANVLVGRVQQSCAINDQRHLGTIEVRLTGLTPGVPVTYKLRGAAAAGATFDSYADPTYKAFIRADYEY